MTENTKKALNNKLFDLEQAMLNFIKATNVELMTRNLHEKIDGLFDEVMRIAYDMEVALDD